MAATRTISLKLILILAIILAIPTAWAVERVLMPFPHELLTFAGAFLVGLILLAFVDPPLGPHSAAFGALAISVPPALFAVVVLLFGGKVPYLFPAFRAIAVACGWSAALTVLAVFIAERRGA